MAQLTALGRALEPVEALATTLGAFALILLLTRLKVPLVAAVLVGAAFEGLLLASGAPADRGVAITRAAASGAVHPQTLGLAAVTVLLLALSGTMQRGGQMERIVAAARALLRRPSLTMAALPALIGLLPMPGGALFSAPMVESAAGGQGRSRAKLSAVNYWFRHIWEHWWPLYPGVLVAMTYVPSYAIFVAYQFPLGVFMVTAGLLLFRKTGTDLHAARPAQHGAARRLLAAAAPVWIILAVCVPAMLAAHWGKLDQLGPIGEAADKFAPIALGVAVSVGWTMHRNRLGLREVRSVWLSRRLIEMVLLVVAVMVFRQVLSAVDAGNRIAAELTGLRVPLVVVAAALPFIAGLVTGLAIGFVGTSFPIVLPMVAAAEGAAALPAWVALAYAFGHLGQMTSPLHVCHVMSNRYFRASFASVYRQIIPSMLVTAALAGGYFAVLRALGL
ncbi:MAG: DUF401 family protein [Phycisphaerae bacterium]|nr:DUF401 family protein [Phycisphaerae bacterium]